MTPVPTGNPSIDAIVPLVGLVDRVAREDPALLWLVWALLVTGLVALTNVAGRLRSFSLAPLLAIPASPLAAMSLIVLMSLLHRSVLWTSPLLTLGIASAVTVCVAGTPFLLPRALRPHPRGIPLVVLMGRPLLVLGPALIIGVAADVSGAWLAPVVGLLVIGSEIVVARFVVAALRGSSTGRSSSDLRQFGSAAPVYVVPDDALPFPAVTAGFSVGATAVFLRQRVEDAVNATNRSERNSALHVLAHEAAHVLGRHTLRRALAVGVAIALTPLVASSLGMHESAPVLVIAVPLATAIATTLGFEASARRFADTTVRDEKLLDASTPSVQRGG